MHRGKGAVRPAPPLNQGLNNHGIPALWTKG
jgi:hypothetical protein